MPESLRHVPDDAILLGWDFSTGGVKCLAFDIGGVVRHAVHLPNDLFTQGGVSELNLYQLEGQARATVRALSFAMEQDSERWAAGGISATHHTAGRIDHRFNPVRRAICWNDQTLAHYHSQGLRRLGGMPRVRELIGGPWPERYSLSHLVKDEVTLPETAWVNTLYILSHGSLAAGYLTGHFGTSSISSAASTGLMDLRTNAWRREMLDALEKPEHRDRAWKSLPIIDTDNDPIGSLSTSVQADADLDVHVPIFPTLDDQAAGLVGGGATDPGHVAVILGNSAVVNSAARTIPDQTNLDVMKLNWGPYLLMRCFSNGAQFLDRVVGDNPDWAALEREACRVEPGCGGFAVLPFVLSEPSLNINSPRFEWIPHEPQSWGVKVRAAFEALAFLIALGVQEHQCVVESIHRINVSGGIARSQLMLEILASVLNRPLERLESEEGPALGAAVAALWGLESHERKLAGASTPYTIADAVRQMVRYGQPVLPNPSWIELYSRGLSEFRARL